MKKLIILLFVFLSINCFAQLEVKPSSFKEVVGFINSERDMQYDNNGKLYSVLKIRTENINDKQRRELTFKTNDNIQFETRYEVGEVWLYISYYAQYLKISHPEFGSTEFYFPFDMQGKKGYEVTLVNKTSGSTGHGVLILTTKPEDHATIVMNGKKMKEETPLRKDMIAAGHYQITVSKQDFASVTKSIEVYDGDTTKVEIEMPYLYGSINIQSNPPGATVFLDDKKYGTTPLTLDKINYGSHEIRIEKKGCNNYKKKFYMQYKEINIVKNIEKCPDNAAPGVFSVGPNKKVHFSKSILSRYYVYNKTKKIVLWGFSGDDLKRNPKNKGITYDGSEFHWLEGDNSMKLLESFHDWGKYVDGNWRTLSRDEWDYVLFKRQTKSGIRYIRDNKGILLLPDDWTANDTIDKWYDWREATGTVSLGEGEYWSSTGKERFDVGHYWDIYCVMIKDGEVSVTTDWFFANGDYGKKYVRLVTPAK